MRASPPKAGKGVLAKRRHAIFVRRSYGIWKAMCQRIAAGAGAVPDRITMTLEEMRTFIRESIGALCLWCDTPLTERSFSLDHRTPLDAGGEDRRDNYRVICVPCNRAKGNFDDHEFAALLTALRLINQHHPKVGPHVLRSLKIANSFRIGSDRRAKKAAIHAREASRKP